MTKDGSVEAAIYDIDDVGPQLDSYRSSLVCKARVELCTPPLGECSKYSTMQRYDLCTNHLLAQLMVKESDTLTIHAFSKIVEQLCNLPKGSAIPRDALLDAPVMESHSGHQEVKYGLKYKKTDFEC